MSANNGLENAVNTIDTKVYTGNQLKALEMLGNGLSPEITASALGVSASYISQLMGDEHFATQVTERRFINLQAATSRDRKYDEIEDALADKLVDLLPMMYKPAEVIRAVATINALKRRGANAPTDTSVHQTIVQLTLPTAITSRFVTNINNQVISVGEQDLITIKSGNLTDMLSKLKQPEHFNLIESSGDS